MARLASSSVLISTNAKPRARPVAMSRITFTVSTVPACAKRSWRSDSPVSKGRLPTNNFRPMLTPVSRERDVLCTAYQRRHLDGQNRPYGGISSRSQAGRQEERVREELVSPKGGTARGKIRREKSYHSGGTREAVGYWCSTWWTKATASDPS